MEGYPDRRSVRLQSIKYTESGSYFITICTHERRKLFGSIADAKMRYSKMGEIAYDEILKTNDLRRASGIQITKFIVMPNHVHFIVEISHCKDDEQLSVGTQRAASDEQFRQYHILLKQSVPTVIRSYKAAVTKCIRESIVDSYDIDGRSTLGPYKNSQICVWQSRYFEHIIRNNLEYKKIWTYIENNPYSWETDRFYTI